MRTYGRIFPPSAPPYWVEVSTDANGFNDYVYLTTLCQVLLLGRGESPFYANYGIPAQQSVLTQVQPDYYMSQTAQQFAGYFAALTLAKLPAKDGTLYYRINVTFNNGVSATEYVPVPQ
jgi:hypothetical protein